MAKNVIMPALGIAQETGRVIRWLKAEGESVAKGEPLLEIETDKATVEVEAAASGTLASITAREGDERPVGEVIALILAPDEARTAAASERPAPIAASQPAFVPVAAQAASPVAARAAADHGVDLAQVKPGGGRVTKADVLAYVEAQKAGQEAIAPDGNGGRVPASPKARRLAGERGIDLRALAGSGPGGAVLAADVLAASPAEVAASPAPGRTLEISTMWRVMVERLSAAWPAIPHFYLTREVDATRLIGWREMALKRGGEKVTYTDLLVKLIAATLREHPRANGAWRDGAITLNDEINIGLAVAVEAGLVVPVIHHADRLTLAELAARRQDAVDRASAGKLRPSDLEGGTFTLSNLGMYGVDAFSAIVNPPQAAILAVGRIADRVVAVNGQPAVRPTLVMTLSFDHRAVDGARGAQFLDALAALIEEPMGLIE